MTASVASRGKDVHFRKHVGSLLQSRGRGGDSFAEGGEEFLFQRDGSFFGAEDFVFVLFEFRRDEAFLVFERLLADVFRRNLRGLSGGNFQVVAKDFVEPDLQVRQAEPFGFLRLIAGDPLFAAASEVSQFVERRVESGADAPPSVVSSGGSSTSVASMMGANLGIQIEVGFEQLQQRALTPGEFGFESR